MPHFLTTHDAAELLGVSVRKINRLVNAGAIPHIRLPTGEVRFDGSDLREWAASLKQPARDLSHA